MAGAKKTARREPVVQRRPLAREAVLSLGKAEPQVIRAGAPAPAPDTDPVEGVVYDRVIREPDEHQTIADRLDYLVAAFDGRYERTVTQDGVQFALILKDGTRIGGAGASTTDAFNALLDNAQAFVRAGLASAGREV